jgi:predicted DNA-binding transcriptional regulator AlpA
MMSDLGDAPPAEPELYDAGITDDRGALLRMPEILARTGMADGTVRSRYHAGTMPCVWKLGRRLVAWERDLIAWLDEERERTSKG